MPKLAACQLGPFAERLQLRPGNRRMDTAAKSAIGRSDDTLATHAFRETDNALGDQFRMFHDVGGVTDHARQNDLAFRKLDVLPHVPLVLMAHIAGFERIGLALNSQHDIDDVAHRNIGSMWALTLPL